MLQKIGWAFLLTLVQVEHTCGINVKSKNGGCKWRKMRRALAAYKLPPVSVLFSVKGNFCLFLLKPSCSTVWMITLSALFDVWIGSPMLYVQVCKCVSLLCVCECKCTIGALVKQQVKQINKIFWKCIDVCICLLFWMLALTAITVNLFGGSTTAATFACNNFKKSV